MSALKSKIELYTGKDPIFDTYGIQIDMEKNESKEKVFYALEQALKPDRSRTKIMKISEFGLVEMTRKRVRDSLGRTLCQPCTYCEGRGSIKSPTTVCYEIFREIQRIINA